MSEQIKMTPIEAINEYYRLKSRYQTIYYDKYVKQIIDSKKSNKEKRVEYSRLPKHACINCKRNVETIWSSYVVNRESMKYFNAKCGDLTDPCPLDIQIKYATRLPMDKDIRTGLSQIEKIKLNIIKEKNNSIFFKKEVGNIFNKLTEELKLETENTGFIIETNILRNDNPEKAIILKQTINEFGTKYIIPFKQMVKDFEVTDNEPRLNQAIKFYVDEIIPMLKEIQSLKYDVSIVEYDEITNIYKLIQLPNSLESNEIYYKSDDKVVKFITGVKGEKKKTRKERNEGAKTKTKKIRPVANLVLVEDETEAGVGEEVGGEEAGAGVGEEVEES